MDNLTKLALSKAIGKVDPISPGTYEIDKVVTVHLKGKITKAEPIDYTPTADIPLKTVLAIVLDKAGVMSDKIENIIIESMIEAIHSKDSPSVTMNYHLSNVNSAHKRVLEMLGTLPKKQKEGSTKVDLTIEELPNDKAS